LVHRQGGQPENTLEIFVSEDITLSDALVKAKLVNSKSEARRVIEQGGVKVDDQVVTDIDAPVGLTEGGVVIQKGKRHFVRLVRK